MVHSLHPAEVARLLESLPIAERAALWEMVDPDDEGDVLVELNDEVRDGLIEGMQTEELIAATEGMEVDDLADLLADLPEAVTQQVLQSLDRVDHDRLQQVLAYDEDCAGGLMNVDIVTVRPDVTLEVVARYLRAVGEMPDGTDLIFVVNRDNEYVGSLFLSRLLTHDPEVLVSSIMSTDVMPIPAHTPSTAGRLGIRERDLLSAPVVDDDYRVVGRITVDDVVDEIRDEAEHALMSAAGLDEEDDMFAPVFKSARRRALWLGVNLLTAFLAASVVDLFQTTIDKIVLLAVLMPVVPSMGGVAGTQSLVIITRAMALGQVDKTNATGHPAQGTRGWPHQRHRLVSGRRNTDLSLVRRLAHRWRYRRSDDHQPVYRGVVGFWHSASAEADAHRSGDRRRRRTDDRDRRGRLHGVPRPGVRPCT